jgi:cell division protein FtsW
MASAAAARSGAQPGREPLYRRRVRARPPVRRVAPPLEHRILMTATLCLLAFGAVMVYSASSPIGVLGARGGSGTGEFLRYLAFGGLGLVAMNLLARRGMTLLNPGLVNLLLLGSFALLVLVMVPMSGSTRISSAAGPAITAIGATACLKPRKRFG